MPSSWKARHMTAAALLLSHNPLQLSLYQCKYWVLIPVSKKQICKQRKRKESIPSAGSSSKSSKQELLKPYWNRNKSWIQVYLFCFVFPNQSNKRKFDYEGHESLKVWLWLEQIQGVKFHYITLKVQVDFNIIY